MKIETLLIKFIREAPFNRKGLAYLCGIHENYLQDGFLKERGLPKIHIYSILEVCVKFGFNIDGSQVICLPETESIIIKSSIDEPPEAQEINVNGATRFIYRERQYRRFIDNLFDVEF